VSAQQSRIKKKEEVIHLKTLIEQRDDKIERLTYILAERVPQAVLSLVMKDIKAIWPSEVE